MCIFVLNLQSMKIKRKLYPNSNDKEFILMSVNDLELFAYDAYAALSVIHSERQKKIYEGENLQKELEVNPIVIVKSLIASKLNIAGLKTPASHLKKLKKYKCLDFNYGPGSETDREIIKLYADTALPQSE